MEFEFMLPRNTKFKKQNMVINSNDRWHPQEKAKMTKRIRGLANYCVSAEIDKQAKPFSSKNPCRVSITVYSPTRSRLDPPNLYPTIKAIIDGMTDAGIWVDDNYKVIRSMSFSYGGLSGKKGYYRFVLTVEEVNDV